MKYAAEVVLNIFNYQSPKLSIYDRVLHTILINRYIKVILVQLITSSHLKF